MWKMAMSQAYIMAKYLNEKKIHRDMCGAVVSDNNRNSSPYTFLNNLEGKLSIFFGLVLLLFQLMIYDSMVLCAQIWFISNENPFMKTTRSHERAKNGTSLSQTENVFIKTFSMVAQPT